MITGIAIIIGILLAGAGVYYLVKEKEDEESRKIYIVTLLVGVVLVAGGIVKMGVLG